MVLDIDLFRPEKGANLAEMFLNQRQRFKPTDTIELLLENDIIWRECRHKENTLNRIRQHCKGVMMDMIRNMTLQTEIEAVSASGDAACELPPINLDEITPASLERLPAPVVKMVKARVEYELCENEEVMMRADANRIKALAEIGNLLHPSVPISNDENHNQVVCTWGDVTTRKRYSHVDLIHMIGGVELDSGVTVAGGRGFFLMGPAVLLQLALCQMAMQNWALKGYIPIYPPYFMRKEVMQQVAQLSQFDEELYKVIGKASEKLTDRLPPEEKYLIATSEQPLAALHRDQWIPEAKLPIRYIGQSTCFRQEVGSHGRDTRGIFRVHQFEKIEQFCITAPHDDKSWEMMEEMINNAKEFYESLGIAYQIVNIVSGALNNAASKKLDLEAWFPGSGAFRELVSCSNCLDYQSRSLMIRYGQTKRMNAPTEYVHMLNATACATTRVICAILETYQTETGVKVPEALKKYLPPDFPDEIPFVKPAPIDLEESKKHKDAQKKKNGAGGSEAKKEEDKSETQAAPKAEEAGSS